jgi:hypothetical protein
MGKSIEGNWPAAGNEISRAAALIQESIATVTAVPTSSLSDAELDSLVADVAELLGTLQAIQLGRELRQGLTRRVDTGTAEHPTTRSTVSYLRARRGRGADGRDPWPGSRPGRG